MATGLPPRKRMHQSVLLPCRCQDLFIFTSTKDGRLNNRPLKKQLLRITREIGPPPNYELLDHGRRETVRSLTKFPYLLSPAPRLPLQLDLKRLAPLCPNFHDRCPNRCGPLAHGLKLSPTNPSTLSLSNAAVRSQFCRPPDVSL